MCVTDIVSLQKYGEASGRPKELQLAVVNGLALAGELGLALESMGQLPSNK